MLGAQQNRLENVLNIDRNTSENTQAAESKLRDTDFAGTSVGFMKAKILDSVSVEMLRNTNQSAQSVLALFA